MSARPSTSQRLRAPSSLTDEKVLAFVQRDPGATARDVARELFGGTGDPRTTSRAKADRCLRRMREAGKLRREPEDLDRGSSQAFRWFAVEAAP